LTLDEILYLNKFTKNRGNMKNTLLKLVVITALLSNSGCLLTDTGKYIYILSKSSNSLEKRTAMPERKFQAALMHTVERAHHSTLDVLNQNDADKSLKLSRVTLGLELEVEAGIRPIGKIGGEAAFELRFEHLPSL
jgi:hypothetical protein